MENKKYKEHLRILGAEAALELIESKDINSYYVINKENDKYSDNEVETIFVEKAEPEKSHIIKAKVQDYVLLLSSGIEGDFLVRDFIKIVAKNRIKYVKEFYPLEILRKLGITINSYEDLIYASNKLKRITNNTPICKIEGKITPNGSSSLISCYCYENSDSKIAKQKEFLSYHRLITDNDNPISALITQVNKMIPFSLNMVNCQKEEYVRKLKIQHKRKEQ